MLSAYKSYFALPVAFRQTLSATYAANTDYILSIWVSPRVPASLSYDLDLVFYAGNDESNEVKRETFGFSATDVFVQVSSTLTAAEVSTAGVAGQAIRIAFENTGPGSEIGDVDFDLDLVELTTPPADSDSDGVPDTADTCPDSDLSPTVVIDGCDSGVGNTFFMSGVDAGCTISDLITELADEATTHGEFTSSVSQLTNDLKKAGIITGKEKGAMQSCAAQASIP